MNKRIRAHNSVLSGLATFSDSPALDPFTGPDLSRMSADPNRCFVDGADDGDGGSEGQPETVDKSVMLKRIAEERRKIDAAKAEAAEWREKASELDTLRDRLAEIEAEKELAGKSAVEKEQARWQRELDKLRQDSEAKAKALAERDAALEATRREMQADRAQRAMSDALIAVKAIRPDKAARAASLDIQIEHTDDGMRASYGDVIDGSVAEAVAAWTKDNDHFLPAPAGGAGTRAGSGSRSSKPLHELSNEELLRLANGR